MLVILDNNEAGHLSVLHGSFILVEMRPVLLHLVCDHAQMVKVFSVVL